MLFITDTFSIRVSADVIAKPFIFVILFSFCLVQGQNTHHLANRRCCLCEMQLTAAVMNEILVTAFARCVRLNRPGR